MLFMYGSLKEVVHMHVTNVYYFMVMTELHKCTQVGVLKNRSDQLQEQLKVS